MRLFLSCLVDYATFDAITVVGVGITDNATGTLPFTSTEFSRGSGLTRSNNGVRIGAGITHVVVSAGCYFSHTSGQNYAWCRVEKNGVTTGKVAIASNNAGYGSVQFPAFDLAVQQGDLITINSLEAGQVFFGSNSWLRVAVA